MDTGSGEARAQDLLRQVAAAVHRRDTVERATEVLLDRYDELPADQAREFLESKAREDGRGADDVAEEILGDPRLTGDA